MVGSKQLFGEKRSHECTKTNSRCPHSQEALALEGARPEPANLRPELPTGAGPEEFLASLRPVPGDRGKARAQRGVRLLARQPRERPLSPFAGE